MTGVVNERVRTLKSGPVRGVGRYVLYRMSVNRRVRFNHALLFAAEAANGLALPLLVFEELTYAEKYASDRFHTFVLEGAPETARRLRQAGAGYVFSLRRNEGDPADAFDALARDAAAVVVDDWPLQNPPEAASYAVDSSCVVPASLIPGRQSAANAIRPKIHELLPKHLVAADSLALRSEFRAGGGEFHTEVRPEDVPRLVASCDIDHAVRPALDLRGGAAEAGNRLRRFLEHGLRRYAGERNEPSAHATSGLSPYLHFGQISAVEVALAARDSAAGRKLVADEFLDELVVRRELAFNFAWHAKNPGSLDELPEWARATLAKHARDKRPAVYSREEFVEARTHDDLWNAAQKEMLARGVIAPYYRMYWGKKIIEWSAAPEEALATMIHIHDRFALDGRDPSTYANILWCFGLHDRPWPERPVFGKVRHMSRQGMDRKTDTAAYIREIEALWTSR